MDDAAEHIPGGRSPLLKRENEHGVSRRGGSNELYWRSRSRPRLPVPRSQPSLNLQIFVCLVVAFSWVFTTELSAVVQEDGFEAYVLLYMSTSCLSLFRLDVKVRCAEIDPQRGGLMAKQFAAPFMLVLWLTCNLSFLWALTFVRISTVTAIFSTNTAFVFVLSYMILNEKSNEWKLLAVFCAVVGVCLATIGAENSTGDDDGSEHSKIDAFIGCFLSALAALLAALYKVVFYYLFGEASTVQVMKFLSNIGLINFSCGFLVAPVLYFLDYLHVPGFQGNGTLWILAILSVFCSVFFNLAVNLGVAFTSPLVVSIGMVLGVPLAVVADCVLVGFNNAKHDGLLSVMSVFGYLGCFMAVVFMLVPGCMHLQTGRFTSLSTVSVHGAGGGGGEVEDASIPVVERSISDVFQRSVTNTLLQGRGAPAPPGASFISSFGGSDGLEQEEGDIEGAVGSSQPWIADLDESEGESVKCKKMFASKLTKKRVGLYGNQFKNLTENIFNFGMMLEAMSPDKIIVSYIDSTNASPSTSPHQLQSKRVKSAAKSSPTSSSSSVFGVEIGFAPIEQVDILVLNNGLGAVLSDQIRQKSKLFLESVEFVDLLSKTQCEHAIVFSTPLNNYAVDYLNEEMDHQPMDQNKDLVGLEGLETSLVKENEGYVDVIKRTTGLFNSKVEKVIGSNTSEIAESGKSKFENYRCRHVSTCQVSTAFAMCRSQSKQIWNKLFLKPAVLTNEEKMNKKKVREHKEVGVERGLAQLSVLGCYFSACLLYQSIYNEAPPYSLAVPPDPSKSFLSVAKRQASSQQDINGDISRDELEVLYNIARQML